MMDPLLISHTGDILKLVLSPTGDWLNHLSVAILCGWLTNSSVQYWWRYGWASKSPVCHSNSIYLCHVEGLGSRLYEISTSLIPYSDVVMSAMASQIIDFSIVYSTACSGADQRKHQSSALLAFVKGIYLWQVNSTVGDKNGTYTDQ